MSWDEGRYRAGTPPPTPLAAELHPRRQQQFRRGAIGLALLLAGALLGLLLAPEGPREVRQQLAQAQGQVLALTQRTQDLEALLKETAAGAGQGRLRPADRARHEREGRRYAAALRRVRAQGAAELMEWFVGRWNQLLDHPQPDDRVGRRAATLSLLVGGMAANLNPGDYVPWQAEFMAGNWLAELHFDADGDGLPGSRSQANTHDGFAGVSVCQVAMALNQALRDGRVLMMPEMRCDRAEARMSVFLQGATFDGALSEFVRAVRAQGFIVVERLEHGVRLVLVGMRPPRPPAE